MKRIGLAAFAVAGLVAAACGPAGTGSLELHQDCPVNALDDAAGPVEIEVWHTYVGLTDQAVNQLADEYNASQDRVRVAVENQGTSYEELRRKYEQGLASDDLPAIAIMEDTQTQFLADTGSIVPAANCAQAEGFAGFDELLPIGRNYYSVEDQLLPASLNLASALLYYNRDHFEEAGLDPDDPPGTLAEVRGAAQAIHDAGVADRPFVQNMQPWMMEFWLTGAGSPIVDNDNGRGTGGATGSAFDNETSLRLFRFLDDMEADGLMQAVPGTEGQFDHYFAMGLGQASMMVETSTAVTTINAVLEGTADPEDLGLGDTALPPIDINLDAAPFPGLEAPGQGQVGGGVWYITSTSDPEEQAAAWDFMRFVNEPENQAVLTSDGSYLPSSEAVAELPQIEDEWTNTRRGQWLSLAYDLALDLDPDFPGPLIGPYTEVRDVIRRALDDMIFGNATPEEAVRTADREIDETLREYTETNF